jgi:phospholipid/cholesterol/gamma-HCH transport system substrate-binding protein
VSQHVADVRPPLGLTPHRIRMLLVVGTVTALFVVYAAWTGLAYLGKVGGGLRMTAYLPTSGDSLGPASNVKYHGLVVGRVVTISGEAGKSRAQIVIKRDQAGQIPANVTARVLPSTIFGSEYVELVAPRHPDTQRLQSVQTIPADRSAETLRIMDAVAAGERILRAVDPSQLDATTSALADMLQDNGANVGRFIERASTYLGTMLQHSDAFYRDLRLLGNVTQGAADAEPHLVAALRNSHSTLRLIVDQRRTVDQLITGTTGLSSETSTFLQKNEGNLVGTVYAGEPIVHIYNGRRDKLAQLLQAVPHVLSNGANGVKDGKIVMEGLMQFPFEFGKPYSSGDCVHYVGASASNCRGGGGSYHSPYRGHP